MATTALGVVAAVAGEAAALAAAPPGSDGVTRAAQSPEVVSAQALRDISEEVSRLRGDLREALIGPSLSSGIVAEVRRQFATFLRSNQKYPDYCEIGPGVFTDLYDWHVRHQQSIEITRVDNRTAIRFMFTWMILRPEQTEAFIGIPFDRG